MFHKQAIKDCFQRHYVIIPARDYDSKCNIAPMAFRDLENTRTFVGNLSVSEDYWRSMLERLGSAAGTSSNEVELAVSKALQNRQYIVLPVTAFPASGTANRARTLKLDD